MAFIYFCLLSFLAGFLVARWIYVGKIDRIEAIISKAIGSLAGEIAAINAMIRTQEAFKPNAVKLSLATVRRGLYRILQGLMPNKDDSPNDRPGSSEPTKYKPASRDSG